MVTFNTEGSKDESPPVARVQYHYLLDALRFIAAAAVVVWHYQHFFYTAPGTLADDYDVADSPFIQPLKLLYFYGGHAVEFFFVLSGFIFFWLYHRKIADRIVSARHFAVLRFSRLYPLHFTMLIVVAVLQAVAFSVLGQFIVYPENDLKHFALNLLFASHWGLEDGWSFNAPVWSVSVEILLYIAFFFIAQIFQSARTCIVVGLLLGGAVMAIYKTDIGWAFICFFLGGVIQQISSWQEGQAQRSVKNVAIVVGAGLGALACAYAALFVVPQHFKVVLYMGAFPLVTLCLAGMQYLQPQLGAGAAWLGDLSYAIYMLHFPVQLSIILSDRILGLGIDFTAETFFLAYFLGLFGLSLAVYRGFELPAQRGLRRVLLTPRD